MLEELGCSCTRSARSISRRTSRQSRGTALNPNGRIPTIVDRDNARLHRSSSRARSSIYLAEKTKSSLPADPKKPLARAPVADVPDGAASDRCREPGARLRPLRARAHSVRDHALHREAKRLYTILDRPARPAASISATSTRSPTSRPGRGCASISGPTSHRRLPNLQRWRDLIRERPAVERGIEVPGKEDPETQRRWLEKFRRDGSLSRPSRSGREQLRFGSSVARAGVCRGRRSRAAARYVRVSRDGSDSQPAVQTGDVWGCSRGAHWASTPRAAWTDAASVACICRRRPWPVACSRCC